MSSPSRANSKLIALSYAQPPGTGFPPLGVILIPATPVVLTIAAFLIFTQAAADQGPYSPDAIQASLFLGAASVVILAWACWAALLAIGLIRRKLKLGWILLLVFGLVWGGLLCYGLYDTAASYIDETTRVHGENWPVLKYVFRR